MPSASGTSSAPQPSSRWVNSTQVWPIAPEEPVRKKTIVIPATVISVSANSSRWCSGRSDQSSAGGVRLGACVRRLAAAAMRPVCGWS